MRTTVRIISKKKGKTACQNLNKKLKIKRKKILNEKRYFIKTKITTTSSTEKSSKIKIFSNRKA
jgi:hypothetical protein